MLTIIEDVGMELRYVESLESDRRASKVWPGRSDPGSQQRDSEPASGQCVSVTLSLSLVISLSLSRHHDTIVTHALD